MKAQVIIYSRPGCHLCEEAKAVIGSADCADQYTLNEINIEDDPELLGLYGFDIPVITINGAQAFRHRVTAEQFKNSVVAASGNEPSFSAPS